MPRSNITLGGQELKLDADGDTSIQVSTDDVLVIDTAGSERMRVAADGKVGIGSAGASGETLTVTASGAEATVRVNGASSQDASLKIQGNNTVTNTFKITSESDDSGLTIQKWTGSAYATAISIAADLDIGMPSSNLAVAGAVSKASGSFKIDHPLDSKKDTHHLIHSFIEGPQADLIYRGTATLSSGSATVNIDTVSGMTSGTFVALNTNVQCFTNNETGWTAVKSSISGNTLTITAQDNSCTDTISWMVIGERDDVHMKDTNWTDENGRVIVELEKEDG